jgi:hypothetical protein
MYVQLQNLCADYRVRVDNIPSLPKDQYNTMGPADSGAGRHQYRAAGCHFGGDRTYAVELGDAGLQLFSRCWRPPAASCSTVRWTAICGPFDQTDGKLLWQTRLGSQVFGATVTYRVAGRQYIAVTAGGGFNNGPIADSPRPGSSLPAATWSMSSRCRSDFALMMPFAFDQVRS